MIDSRDLQRDIGQVLCQLLPVQGSAKTLLELREQVRLVNRITDPSDDRLARVIIGYLGSPEHTHGARFLRIDADTSPMDLSARWTRVRIGPVLGRSEAGAKGYAPRQELIEKGLSAIWAHCSRSAKRSFYLWDLLKEHFGVTRENNSHYRQWLLALSEALKDDQRFVIVAVDPNTSVPVEWMLAVDREQQVRDAVHGKLQQVIAFMMQDDRVVHLTRDLVRRFFSPRGVDETYDVHAYYRAVSEALAETPGACQTYVQDGARPAEAWCLTERVRLFVRRRLDSIHAWLLSIGKPQLLAPIVLECFRVETELTSADALVDEVAEALGEDLRFLSLGREAGWRAVPPGPPNNLAAYHILWEEGQPLAGDALMRLARKRSPGLEPSFASAGDPRFRGWRSGKWGLSHWVDINDWAHEYLQMTRLPSERDTIVARVCYRRGIAKTLAVFLPEDDPRFVQHADARWYYRRSLTDAELDQMADLVRGAIEGLTLGELVSRVTGLEACDTDAETRMAGDERFVLVDGRWLARETRYQLSDEDLGALLATLEREGVGLKLATLVRCVLGRQADGTDAEERLRSDPRFHELLPQVWAATTLQMEPGTRTRPPNVPIRSDSLPMVGEDEYNVVEDITVRERGPRGVAARVTRKQLTRTLSLLDIQCGNLVIDRAVASLLEHGDTTAVHLSDERGDEFTCWVDRENKLLQGMGRWYRLRQLTYGDKITLRATGEPGFLEIRPTGQRDDRVYQEGLRRQDLQRLAEAGRRAGKSYHDLIIEVMERFSQSIGDRGSLHRETIYQLVDCDRTASRSYIFSLLSLLDCPYEGLRYFVSHGRGLWLFDPERKRAFDMKMRQLVARVEELEAENRQLSREAAIAKASVGQDGAQMARLRKQAQELQARVAGLSDENARLSSAHASLCDTSEAQQRRLAELAAQVSTLQGQAANLEAEPEEVSSTNELLRKESEELLEAEGAQSDPYERLIEEKLALESMQAQLSTRLQQVLQRVRALQETTEGPQSGKAAAVGETASGEAACEPALAELEARLATLVDEHRAARSELANVRREKDALAGSTNEQCRRIEALAQLNEAAGARQAALERDLERERRRAAELHERLVATERSTSATSQQVAQLAANFAVTRAAMKTRLGRVFVLLSRAFGGPDLSKL